jgi:hypothetical protein
MQNLFKVIFLVLMACGLSRTGTPASPLVPITQLPPAGLLLDKGWTNRAGDNPTWASPGYDDRD